MCIAASDIWKEKLVLSASGASRCTRGLARRLRAARLNLPLFEFGGEQIQLWGKETRRGYEQRRQILSGCYS